MAERRGRHISARRAGAMALLGGLLLASCGSSDAGRSAGSSSREPDGDAATVTVVGWQQDVEVPADWTYATPTELTALHAGDDDRSLVAEVAYVPVRLAERRCAGELGGWTEDEGNAEVVWMMVRTAAPNVLSDPSLEKWADEFGDCPVRRSTLELSLDHPLAGRDVVVDGARWVPGDDGYQPCELPACDPETGSRPATADCTDAAALIEDVRTRGDVPAHSDIGEHRCADGWAMVEVDIGSGACPAGDESCAGSVFDRLFLRAGTPHWEVIGRTRDAGCGDITDLAPEFPTALCVDRPAL